MTLRARGRAARKAQSRRPGRPVLATRGRVEVDAVDGNKLWNRFDQVA